MIACSWRDDVGAYLLGALTDDEHVAFETHLATCGECRAEVDALRVAADALPNSPRQYPAPPEIKDRVMLVVNREAALARSTEPTVRQTRRRVVAVLRPGWWSMRPGLALAMSVLVLAVGAGGALLGTGALRDDEVLQQASVGNAQLIQRASGHSTLVATGLDRPATGHVYQVWLKHKGQAMPQPTNALFSARSDGSASVDVPGSLKDVEQVLVTEEPDGGSAAPTTPAVIVANPA